MRNIFRFIIIVLLALAGAVAGVQAQGSGSSSIVSLLNPLSSRAAAMGEACSGISGDLMTVNYNPAGLFEIENLQVSAMYQKGLSDDVFASVVVGKKFSSGSLGTAVSYYSTGKISLYNIDGDLIRKTGQRDIVLIIGSARRFNFLFGGLNLKFISSEVFGRDALCLAVDMGGQYRVTNDMVVGVSVQNIGPELKYIEKFEKLPYIARSGMSYNLNIENEEFLFALDFPYYINEEELKLNIGLEAVFEDRLSIRLGLKSNLTRPDKIDEKLTLGWGLEVENFEFNYSVGITDHLNIPQRISVDFKY
ncbi:MAG: PorV/PorQ family protein [Elusimicrobiota bacterium]